LFILERIIEAINKLKSGGEMGVKIKKPLFWASVEIEFSLEFEVVGVAGLEPATR